MLVMTLITALIHDISCHTLHLEGNGFQLPSLLLADDGAPPLVCWHTAGQGQRTVTAKAALLSPESLQLQRALDGSLLTQNLLADSV